MMIVVAASLPDPVQTMPAIPTVFDG